MPDFTTVGNYARQLVSRRQNADVRARLDTLTAETGSGRKADLAGAQRGDFTRLAVFEKDLDLLASFDLAAAELRTELDAAQRALGAAQDDTLGFAGTLVAAPEGQATGLEAMATEAQDRFSAVVSALGARVAGRSLFAGLATDAPALAPTEDMLSTLEAITAAAPDAATAEADIRAWFAPGGGFDTVGYLGDSAPVPGRPVGPGIRLSLGATAQDPALREVLAALAVAALSGSGAMAGDQLQRERLTRAGVSLTNAQAGLSDLRGRIGSVEARLEEVRVRNASETDALTRSRALLTDVDIYESATELEAVQSQLELLYAITARSARLSLAAAL